MRSAQMNIRTSKMLIGELDTLVDHGLFRNRTEAVNEAIRILIRRYKAANIAQKIQKTAQKKPMKYRDLTVRVAGYTAYFIELAREMQDEIINRTEHGL